jgi:transcriptional regulator with XRE-family HTH domain
MHFKKVGICMSILMDLMGKRIASLRRKKRWTQEMLAEKLNIGRSSLAQYETAVREPDINTLDLLATIFEVSIDYLFGREANTPMETDLKFILEERRASYYGLLLNDDEKQLALDIFKSLFEDAKELQEKRNQEVD